MGQESQIVGEKKARNYLGTIHIPVLMTVPGFPGHKTRKILVQ